MTDATVPKQRPKYLNLIQIRLPFAGFVSILHRVSGALLFLFLPVLLWLFASSLGSQDSFDAYKAAVSHPLAKLVLLGLLWAYMHHFCAGIRFLFLDMHMGLGKEASFKSAGAVMAVSIILTLTFGGMLLL